MSEYPPDPTGAADAAGRPETPKQEDIQDVGSSKEPVSTGKTRGQYAEGDYGTAGQVPEVPAASEGEYTESEPESNTE